MKPQNPLHLKIPNVKDRKMSRTILKFPKNNIQFFYPLLLSSNLLFLLFAPTVSGIRKSCMSIDIMELLLLVLLISSSYLSLFFWMVFNRFYRKDVSLREKRVCRSTVQGRYLLSDDNGHVCDGLSLDPQSRCCPSKGEQFSCYGCNLVSQCCKSYEFCVSCCLNPTRTQKELALKVKIAKPATAGTYSSVFDFCAGRCRHNSESVVHENAYLSDFHHCFSLPSNSSEVSKLQTEARLAGIKVISGRQGESCDSVCKSNGQSCVPNKLALLNQCETMQKYFTCKGSCLASIGADQPAEVVEDAPKDLNPGTCLYTEKLSMLSCEGSHQQTRRLCPCA